MVMACKGMLLKCTDVSVKELILSFDESANAREQRVVVDVLDDLHLFVREDAQPTLESRLRGYLDRIAFDPSAAADA